MLHLLKIEWLKLKNYRTFWILFILYLLCIYGINLIVYYIQEEIYREQLSKGLAEQLIGNRPYNFPQVWQMTSFVSSFLLFLPGLLMIIFVTNEYSFKTHRQNIIDGWSRKEFISVKLTLALIMAAVSTIAVFITALIFGLQGAASFSFENIQFLGFYFLQALSYCMFAILISVIVRRGVLALGIYFLYSMVVENVANLFMKEYLYGWGRFLPLQSTDELIPVPIFENVQKQFFNPPNYPVLMITIAFYLGLYIFLSNRKFLRADL